MSVAALVLNWFQVYVSWILCPILITWSHEWESAEIYQLTSLIANFCWYLDVQHYNVQKNCEWVKERPKWIKSCFDQKWSRINESHQQSENCQDDRSWLFRIHCFFVVNQPPYINIEAITQFKHFFIIFIKNEFPKLDTDLCLFLELLELVRIFNIKLQR